MKKILSMVLSVVLLASCSSDDKENSINAAKLVDKKWYRNSYIVNGATIPYENDNPDCGRDYSQFESTGVLRDVYFNDCTPYTDTGAWTLNGNNLSITEEGTLFQLKITTLNATTLKIEGESDLNEDGITEKTIVVFKAN